MQDISAAVTLLDQRPLEVTLYYTWAKYNVHM